MEDTLRDPLLAGSMVNGGGGLNPCCNGRYSQSYVADDAGEFHEES